MFYGKKAGVVRFICLMCTACLLLSFVSCNKNEEEQATELEKYYTVSFRAQQFIAQPRNPVIKRA